MKLLLFFIFLVTFISAKRVVRRHGSRSLKTSNNRIAGGEAVNIAEYGWQVSLHYSKLFMCAGSIISKDWVLSAAHCFYNDNTARSFLVRAGTNSSEQGGVVYKPDRIIIHPNFSRMNYDNDVALVHFKSPIQLNGDTIQAVTLVEQGVETPAGTLATVTGWGAPEQVPTTSNRLLGVTVPVVDWDECAEINHQFGGITRNMICAGYKEGEKDACGGDGGGPLVTEEDNTLIGIVSRRSGCAQPDVYGVYTDISAPSIRDFIRTNTNI